MDGTPWSTSSAGIKRVFSYSGDGKIATARQASRAPESPGNFEELREAADKSKQFERNIEYGFRRCERRQAWMSRRFSRPLTCANAKTEKLVPTGEGLHLVVALVTLHSPSKVRQR
jgi:hypothetical protein